MLQAGDLGCDPVLAPAPVPRPPLESKQPGFNLQRDREQSVALASTLSEFKLVTFAAHDTQQLDTDISLCEHWHRLNLCLFPTTA